MIKKQTSKDIVDQSDIVRSCPLLEVTWRFSGLRVKIIKRLQEFTEFADVPK